MRILYVSDAQSMHTRRWAEYFRDEGADVHVASFRPAKITNVTVHVLPTLGLGKVGYLLAVPILRRLWARLQPQVVHAQYVTSYGFLAAAARLRPLVVTAWGTDVLISPRESHLARWFATRALASADQVTTVAEHMNAAVMELGVPAARILASPFGVDTTVFHPGPDSQAESTALRVISTRSFSPIYSVHTVIEAVQRVRASGVHLQLDLVGVGPLFADLKARIDTYGLRDSVTFHGHIDHPRLAVLLRAANIFVSSALSDGNNVSLNEAMACGCFPIATNIPANTQWIEDGHNGLLFPVGDAVRLAEAIMVASANPALRASAARINWQIVEKRANWRMGASRMLEIYQRLAKGMGD